MAYDGLSSYVMVYSSNGTKREYPSIRDFMRSEINSEMKFIFSGGGVTPYQEREQWTDSCNLLTIRPGVAIAYDRNTETEKALIEHGYSIIPALDFLELCKKDPKAAEKLETILTQLENCPEIVREVCLVSILNFTVLVRFEKLSDGISKFRWNSSLYGAV